VQLPKSCRPVPAAQESGSSSSTGRHPVRWARPGTCALHHQLRCALCPCPPGPVVLAPVVPCSYRRLERGRGRVGVPAPVSGVVSRLSCSRAPGVLLRTSNGSAPSHAWVRQAQQLPAPVAASNLRQALA
jgi:hypothetical protein